MYNDTVDAGSTSNGGRITFHPVYNDSADAGESSTAVRKCGVDHKVECGVGCVVERGRECGGILFHDVDKM